jgi:excisionase family DNA binding protein
MVDPMVAREQARLPFSDANKPRRDEVSATLTVPEAAKLLGIGRNLAYQIAADEGELAGVPIIRVGRRMVVPRAPLRAALGLDKGLPSHTAQA